MATPPLYTRLAQSQVEIAIGESSFDSEEKFTRSEVRAIVRTEVEGVRSYFEAEISVLRQEVDNLKRPLLPPARQPIGEIPENFISKYGLSDQGLEYEGEVIIAASQNWRPLGEADKVSTNTWKALNVLFPNRIEVVLDSEKIWGEPITYKDLKAKTGCADPHREVRRLKKLIEESGHSNKVEVRVTKLPRTQKIRIQLVVFDSLPTLPA